MLFTFLFVVQTLVAAGLVGVILMQKSEGGGLGVGGSPAGLMSARGAADFLTRMTSILATAFVGLAVILAVLAATRQTQRVEAVTATPAAPAPASVPGGP
ncbi:MAG: preprotein translocase subunit SecG [Sphingomonas hengshuiensis]|nr:MAG: preprotein translocase subunit SecG [Sphingomonas hengshuiensis]